MLVAGSIVSSPPGAVRAAAVCSGWTSNMTPPSTIRVLRTFGPAAGSVQLVAFRQYVNVVMAAEWGPTNPIEALRAGAIAVKQYAWYYTMVWRGRSGPDGSCYDVIDSTTDQLYSPETRTAAQTEIDAVDSTWTTSLHKSGRLFATGYQGGASVACGADADGHRLYQRSAMRCARDGLMADAILHTYYDPGVQIYRPGGDSTGDGLGDVIVVSPGVDPSSVGTRIYPSGRVPDPATAAALQTSLAVPASDTLFRGTGDVNGDHVLDLVVLSRSADGTLAISVALGTGSALAAATTWWSGPPASLGITPTSAIRFVVGDFGADGRADVAILAGEPGSVAVPLPIPSPTASGEPSADPSSSPAEPPVTQGTLWLLASTGSGFAAPRTWWTGPLDVGTVLAFAGDVDADGRADVILQVDQARQQPAVATGLRYSVIRSTSGSSGSLEPWLDLPDTPADRVRAVVADVNRDGRADVIIDRVNGTVGSQLLGLISNGVTFVPRSMWSNASSFRWSASRLAASDVNGDGRVDVVVLYNAGAAGTRFYPFLSSGTSLRPAPATTDPTLPWAGAAPY